jgi:hypothetical protein
MSVLKNYTEAKKKMKAALAEANAIVKDAFLEVAAGVFSRYPALESFSWTQYTPYFNDGDECVFRTNTEYPELSFVDGASIDLNYGGNEADEAARAKEIAAVQTLLAQFDEDDYKRVFGDHVKVTVSRTGIDTDAYDHE